MFLIVSHKGRDVSSSLCLRLCSRKKKKNQLSHFPFFSYQTSPSRPSAGLTGYCPELKAGSSSASCRQLGGDTASGWLPACPSAGLVPACQCTGGLLISACLPSQVSSRRRELARESGRPSRHRGGWQAGKQRLSLPADQHSLPGSMQPPVRAARSSPLQPQVLPPPMSSPSDCTG